MMSPPWRSLEITAMTELLRRTVPGGTVLVRFRGQGLEAMARTEYFDGSWCQTKDPMPVPGLEWSGPSATELELTHHFLAMTLQWPASHRLWCKAHDGRSPPGWTREQDWPYAAHDEDVLAMHLIGFLGNGRLDGREDLEAIWGHRLKKVMAHLVSWLRPWVEAPSFSLPLPLRPRDVSFPLAEESEAEIPMGRAALRMWS
jgi:hypothetical protein